MNSSENKLNDSNDSDDRYLSTPEFTGLTITLLTFIPPAILLHILTAIALLLDRTILKPLRILLLNLVTGEFLTALYVTLHMTSAAVLSTQSDPNPDGQLCRFILWCIGTVLAARMFCVTAYSIGVFVFVRRGAAGLKTLHAVIAIIVVWLLALIMGIDRWLPFSVGTLFVHQVACVPFVDGAVILALRISSVTSWIIIAGIIPTIICITLPIVALYYLKRKSSHGLVESGTYKKAMTKLALFLIIGSIVNIIWIFIPGVAVMISSFFPLPESSGEIDLAGVVTVYFSFPILTLSLVPPCLIIVIFLKAVQQKFKEIFCCICIVRCCISLKTRRKMVRRTTASVEIATPLTSSNFYHVQ